MNRTKISHTILYFISVCALASSMQINATNVTLCSYSQASSFAPFQNLEDEHSTFILETVAQSKPYLWIGSDKSLLRSIQTDNLIVCFEDTIPVGFLSYHTLIVPPYGLPYCEACKTLKDSQKSKRKVFVGHIHILAIKKNARGKGYGTLLVKKAIEQIKMLGKSKKMSPVIGIAVNPKNEPAVNLYTKKFGFENLNVLIHRGVHWVLKQSETKELQHASPSKTSRILYTTLLLLFIGLCLFILYRRGNKHS